MKIVAVGSVLITIWDGDPSLEDVNVSLDASIALHARTGRPLTLIGILTETAKMPNNMVRQQMLQNWEKLMKRASNMRYVSFTSGFTSARLISLLVSAFALTQHGKHVSVHRTIAEAIREARLIDPTIDAVAVEAAIKTAMKQSGSK
jgi:hypothetical protein